MKDFNINAHYCSCHIQLLRASIGNVNVNLNVMFLLPYTYWVLLLASANGNRNIILD